MQGLKWNKYKDFQSWAQRLLHTCNMLELGFGALSEIWSQDLYTMGNRLFRWKQRHALFFSRILFQNLLQTLLIAYDREFALDVRRTYLERVTNFKNCPVFSRHLQFLYVLSPPPPIFSQLRNKINKLESCFVTTRHNRLLDMEINSRYDAEILSMKTALRANS